MPDVYEDIISLTDPYIITAQFALQLRANREFTDVYGNVRKAGEEYLITNQMATQHNLDIYEEFVQMVALTVLNKLQYCFITNPVDLTTNLNRLGFIELRQGEASFFLLPGEIQSQILDAYVLAED